MQAKSTAIRTRSERCAELSDRRRRRSANQLRQQSGFYISDWPRDATGFTRSDFDHLVRQGRIHVRS